MMRDEKITISKAIAIMLMVICHAGLPNRYSHFVSMFHMPLFFFVSGYCFKDKYLIETKQFLKNKIRGIYVPFVKWSLIFLVLHNVFFSLNVYGEMYDVKSFMKNAIYIIFSMNETEQLLGGYWFLKELFLGSILALGCFKYLKSNFCWAATLLLIAVIVSSWIKMDIPFVHIASRTFFAGFFIVMGREYKKLNYDTDQWLITILCFIIVMVGSIYCGTSMLSYSTIQVVPYSICALMGTIMILNLSHRITFHKNILTNFLLIVGNHTLEVLTWHFLTFKLVSLFIICKNGLSLENLSSFPIINEYGVKYWIVYSLIGIAIPISGVYIRQRICFFMNK